MRIAWKWVEIHNFKGCTYLRVDFKDLTHICGQNASGKTTVLDAITWLMFGKDSLGREKFEIRTLDENGDKIHNTEILVKGECEIDGKSTLFSRKQKENWVKKRGSDHPVLQGNVNEMEINGFPKSDKEFRDEINRIVDENLFKALSNPMYFPSLAWKEQREMLMGFVSDVSDVDLAKEMGGFDEILSDLEYASSTDDIQKKYNKAKKELKEKADEIPVRIDEISKSRVYVDVDALENKKKGIQNQLAELDKEIASGVVDISGLQNELASINVRLSEIKAEEDEKLREVRSKLKDSLDDAERKAKDLRFERSQYNDKIIADNRAIADGKSKLDKMRSDYEEIKERQMDSKATICKMCGRLFEADKIDEIKRIFEENRENDLKEINEQAKKINAEIKDLGGNVDRWNDKISAIDKELETIDPLIDDIKSELAGIPTMPEYEENDEYKELLHRKDDLEVTMAEKVADGGDTTDAELRRDKLKEELSEVEAEIGKASKNEDIDVRIEALENQQKSVQQRLADAEKMEYLIDNFIRAKMERVSQTINAQFDICDFKLFEEQLNGGVRETCELKVNGVPYSVLNSGHRIVAGLDIIKSLQRLLDCVVPVWVDNSETINSFNLPQMDSQMVLLTVTDDEELKFM